MICLPALEAEAVACCQGFEPAYARKHLSALAPSAARMSGVAAPSVFFVHGQAAKLGD